MLFQPWARKLSPYRATLLGLTILLPAYGLIAWGATQGYLAAVLLGTIAASSAGYFLMAYLGFSIPVITTGILIDVLRKVP